MGSPTKIKILDFNCSNLPVYFVYIIRWNQAEAEAKGRKRKNKEIIKVRDADCTIWKSVLY